jgi:gamma-glutamyltranspeptidase/glutathione hydrolase
MVSMLHLAHAHHGRAPWKELLKPAIDMAESGVPMPERLRQQLSGDPSLLLFRGTRRNLRSQRSEDVLENVDLADTLRRVAEGGPQAFYRGEVAESIVAAATGRRLWPSDMTLEDLADYKATLREPVCGTYRQWRICGAPPPSSGGIAVLQTLKMLERFDLAATAPGSVEAVHLIAEASRLAFADRDQYVGDPAFVDVPVEALLDPVYLAGRSALISLERAMGSAPAGDPTGAAPATGGGVPPNDIDEEGKEADDHGTSHLVIMDTEGNVVSLTGSIESPFGSRLMVRGFLLNNQLTDFSFRPTTGGLMRANAVAPGKRPRSSMSPTIVFGPDGVVRMAIGSRGGSRIIGYVIKSLIGVLDWNLDLQEAIALPNFLHRGQTLELERGTPLEAIVPELVSRGHRVDVRTLTSGLHGVERVSGTLRGGADPRLGGLACGIPSP